MGMEGFGSAIRNPQQDLEVERWLAVWAEMMKNTFS